MNGKIHLTEPDVELVSAAERDESASWDRDYLGESLAERTDVLYRSIVVDDELVGEIFLHDIGASRPGSALVGFALYQPRFRSRGVGTQALALMLSLVERETDLNELVVITSADNYRAIRIATKNGFVAVGPPREDPHGVCLIWSRPPDA